MYIFTTNSLDMNDANKWSYRQDAQPVNNHSGFTGFNISNINLPHSQTDKNKSAEAMPEVQTSSSLDDIIEQVDAQDPFELLAQELQQKVSTVILSWKVVDFNRLEWKDYKSCRSLLVAIEESIPSWFDVDSTTKWKIFDHIRDIIVDSMSSSVGLTDLKKNAQDSVFSWINSDTLIELFPQEQVIEIVQDTIDTTIHEIQEPKKIQKLYTPEQLAKFSLDLSIEEAQIDALQTRKPNIALANDMKALGILTNAATAGIGGYYNANLMPNDPTIGHVAGSSVALAQWAITQGNRVNASSKWSNLWWNIADIIRVKRGKPALHVPMEYNTPSQPTKKTKWGTMTAALLLGLVVDSGSSIQKVSDQQQYNQKAQDVFTTVMNETAESGMWTQLKSQYSQIQSNITQKAKTILDAENNRPGNNGAGRLSALESKILHKQTVLNPAGKPIDTTTINQGINLNILPKVNLHGEIISADEYFSDTLSTLHMPRSFAQIDVEVLWMILESYSQDQLKKIYDYSWDQLAIAKENDRGFTLGNDEKEYTNRASLNTGIDSMSSRLKTALVNIEKANAIMQWVMENHTKLLNTAQENAKKFSTKYNQKLDANVAIKVELNTDNITQGINAALLPVEARNLLEHIDNLKREWKLASAITASLPRTAKIILLVSLTLFMHGLLANFRQIQARRFSSKKSRNKNVLISGKDAYNEVLLDTQRLMEQIAEDIAHLINSTRIKQEGDNDVTTEQSRDFVYMLLEQYNPAIKLYKGEEKTFKEKAKEWWNYPKKKFLEHLYLDRRPEQYKLLEEQIKAIELLLNPSGKDDGRSVEERATDLLKPIVLGNHEDAQRQGNHLESVIYKIQEKDRNELKRIEDERIATIKRHQAEFASAITTDAGWEEFITAIKPEEITKNLYTDDEISHLANERAQKNFDSNPRRIKSFNKLSIDQQSELIGLEIAILQDENDKIQQEKDLWETRMKAYYQFLGQFNSPNEAVVFPGMEKKILMSEGWIQKYLKNIDWENEKSQNAILALRKFINELGHKEYAPKQKQVKMQQPTPKKASVSQKIVQQEKQPWFFQNALTGLKKFFTGKKD